MKTSCAAVLFFFGAAAFFGCSEADDEHDAGTPDSSLDVPLDETADGGCPAGLTYCSGYCVDLSSSHEHCGSCGNACEPAEVCSAGACAFECPPGTSNCGGGCVDTSDDVRNCGGCGVECTAGEHADPVCEDGSCSIVCHYGWADMDGDGSCESNCVPSGDESCNGLDDNCDGRIDEGFACRPGQTANQPCGNCGTQSRECAPDCSWGSWDECTGEGECAPGAEDEQECGDCGTQFRECAPDCSWGSWGECTGEGECSPGTERACGDCGTETCTPGCTWGECTGEGECSPGAVESRSCGGGCGNQTRRCDDACTWGDWSSCDASQVTITMTDWNGAGHSLVDCETAILVLDWPSGGFAHNCPAGRCRWDPGAMRVKAYFKVPSECPTDAYVEGSYRPRGSCSVASSGGLSVTCCAD